MGQPDNRVFAGPDDSFFEILSTSPPKILQIRKDSRALATTPSLSPIGFSLSVHDGWVEAWLDPLKSRAFQDEKQIGKSEGLG